MIRMAGMIAGLALLGLSSGMALAQETRGMCGYPVEVGKPAQTLASTNGSQTSTPVVLPTPGTGG